MRFRNASLPLLLSLLAATCSSESTDPDPQPQPDPEAECETNADCAEDAPYCAPEAAACAAAPPGGLIGWGDGSATSVGFTLILDEDLKEPTDLAFHPTRAELWVTNRKDDSVVIITEPGEPNQTAERRHDPAAAHFMDRPPAIAFGVGDTFGVCGDSDNGGNDFMGPALFSSDLAIFAESTPDGLGSHLDMLHSTSFCRGIAHEKDNAYWVFNSDKQSLDRYDFKEDHGPGNDDHSDGEILRYGEDAVLGVDGVPSHLFFGPDAMLYVADTGNKRVAKLDPSTATMGSTFSGNEPADRRKMEGATITDVVPAGTLEAPSGIEIFEDVIYVSDSAQGLLYAFDMKGELLRTLDTTLPSGALAGIAIGPDARLYFVDLSGGRVFRVDPQ